MTPAEAKWGFALARAGYAQYPAAREFALGEPAKWHTRGSFVVCVGLLMRVGTSAQQTTPKKTTKRHLAIAGETSDVVWAVWRAERGTRSRFRPLFSASWLLPRPPKGASAGSRTRRATPASHYYPDRLLEPVHGPVGSPHHAAWRRTESDGWERSMFVRVFHRASPRCLLRRRGLVLSVAKR